MNLVDIQNEILHNPEHIITILEQLGHKGIVDRNTHYQCYNIDGDNPTACCVRKDNLVWSNFSHGLSGSIWTMIQEEAHVNFKESLKLAGKWIGFKDEDYVKIVRPFSGFYRAFNRNNDNSIIDLPVHSEEELPSAKAIPYKWMAEGISAQTLAEWGVRLDLDNDEIIIPWNDYYGNLVGAKSRSNDPNCDMKNRWGMFIKFQMSQICYGWNKNYNSIIQKGTVIIFEAEKSTLIAAEWGLNICISLGGHNVSKAQQQMIKALMCEKVIIAFDEGLNEEEIKHTCKKLQMKNKILTNKVGYIWDEDGKILKPGSKNSPADVGIDNFKKLLKENVRYI